jgi:predicted small metal-binding protein
MGRKVIDCREHPIAIAADSDGELLEAAVIHAVSAHGHADSKELREMISQGIKEAALT